MRVLRAKQTRKYLRFFQIVFGIKAPYNVLLDGNFVFTLLKLKLDVRDRLLKLLQGSDIQYFMLLSAFNELKAVGAKTKAAAEFAKAFCEIVDDESTRGETPGERIKQYLEQERLNTRGKKFIVATQDRDLRSTLGYLPGVPIIYANKVSVVLEPPSKASKDFGAGIELAKTELSRTETIIVGKAIKASSSNSSSAGGASASSTASEVATQAARTKRKATAANPLSNAARNPDSTNSRKRKNNKYKK